MIATLFLTVLFAALSVQAAEQNIEELAEAFDSQSSTPALYASATASTIWPDVDTPVDASSRPDLLRMPLSSSLLMQPARLQSNLYASSWHRHPDMKISKHVSLNPVQEKKRLLQRLQEGALGKVRDLAFRRMDKIATAKTYLKLDADNFPKVNFDQWLDECKTGDLMLASGNYILANYLRSQYGGYSSHSGVIWRDPYTDVPYLISAFDWDGMRPNFPVPDMKDYLSGEVLSGTSIHPLKEYVSAVSALEGAFTMWRPLRDENGNDLSAIERASLSEKIMDWAMSSKGCGSPYATNMEMYSTNEIIKKCRKQMDEGRMPDLMCKTVKKPVKGQRMNCASAVANVLESVGILRKDFGYPYWAATSSMFEAGGMIEKFMTDTKHQGDGWINSDKYSYGDMIYVEYPEDNMYEHLKESSDPARSTRRKPQRTVSLPLENVENI